MNAAFYASLNKSLMKLETAVQLALANVNQEDPDRWLLGEMRDIIVKVKQELRPPPMVPIVQKEGRGKEVVVAAGVVISVGAILTFLKILAIIALVAVLAYLYANYVAPRLQERRISALLTGLSMAAIAVQRFEQIRTRVERQIRRFPHCQDNWRRFILACNFLMDFARLPSSGYPVVSGAQRTAIQRIERNIELLIDALESIILCMDPDDATGLYDEIIAPTGRVRVILNRVRVAAGRVYERLPGVRRPADLQHLRSPPSGQ